MQKFNMWETQIFRAEQTLNDDADKITEDDKKELQDKLDAMKAVFNVKPDERDMSACEAASKELQTVQWKVSEALYKAANPDASTANPFGGFGGSSPFGQGFDFSNMDPNAFKGAGGGQ
jgi:molecular chaperone DnaK